MRGAAVIAVFFVLASATASADAFSDYTGRQLYARFCASCHGDAGFGDGPVAPSLKVVVPDLTRIYRNNGEKFPEDLIRKIIDGRQVHTVHGTRYMPVWGQVLSAEEGAGARADADVRKIVDKLVDYLHSIQQ